MIGDSEMEDAGCLNINGDDLQNLSESSAEPVLNSQPKSMVFKE